MSFPEYKSESNSAPDINETQESSIDQQLDKAGFNLRLYALEEIDRIEQRQKDAIKQIIKELIDEARKPKIDPQSKSRFHLYRILLFATFLIGGFLAVDPFGYQSDDMQKTGVSLITAGIGAIAGFAAPK